MALTFLFMLSITLLSATGITCVDKQSLDPSTRNLSSAHFRYDVVESTTLPPISENLKFEQQASVETGTIDAATSKDLQDTTTTTAAPKRLPVVCTDDNYCLNGGTCVINEAGHMACLCPEGFYGSRCQTRDICQTIIVASLTGEQICAQIGRSCLKEDKFFRCSCHEDEYFVFKTIPVGPSENLSGTNEHRSDRRRYDSRQQASTTPSGGGQLSIDDFFSPSPLQRREQYDQNYDQFSMEDTETLSQNTKEEGDFVHNKGEQQPLSTSNRASFQAECRKMDKCLNKRCRRLSEVCQEGECVCNQPAGYTKDPKDGHCKLLDPCQMPPAFPGAWPICGKAQCVATYDHELYRCVCPVGYKALKVGQYKNSTQCALLKDTICTVPLLNKCQHTCTIDSSANNYRCSCLAGYRLGSQVGVDDHMCFFDDHMDLSPDETFGDGRHRGGRVDFDNDAEAPSSPPNSPRNNGSIKYEYVYRSNLAKPSNEIRIRRELRPVRDNSMLDSGSSIGPRVTDDEDDFSGINLSKMSAQERCNMYCEENKICALESGSLDSYRCVCDRQGYVSVGDRCLDWCAAAVFSYRVRDSLEKVCLSGVCKPLAVSPGSKTSYERRVSSWRPTFECDCSSSPLLVQSPETKLCKLDFQAILDPCLPGNIGYVDCVENKNAYCSVLHRSSWIFFKDLQKEQPIESTMSSMDKSNNSGQGTGSNRLKLKAKDKLYTCVCSPEKKFLVDKPRNKARCVDECELLNVECGRFNRMCRSATIAADDYGRRNLVRLDQDGVRMDFKRTGCECLPGFNVGPYESVDFTLDDNNAQDGSGTTLTNHNLPETYPPIVDLINPGESEGGQSASERHRAKYMNINSRCLLDYDVVEFHASFKAPADFDPTWVSIKSSEQLPIGRPIPAPSATAGGKSPAVKRQACEPNSKKQVGNVTSGTSNGSPSDQVEHEENCNVPGSEQSNGDYVLKVPEFMRLDVAEFHKSVVLVAQCDALLARLSLEAYQQCIKYRYWIVQKLRNHFVDWRRVMNKHLSNTFDLMEGNIKLHVNKCEAVLRRVSDQTEPTRQPDIENNTAKDKQDKLIRNSIDPIDQHAIIDADIECALTLHSASDGSSSIPRYSRKVLLEKQLQKFIFNSPFHFGQDYYLMAPNMLIRRESFDQLAAHRQSFNPCDSDYDYCDKQTKCEMVDTVNFTCTCETGYTPIGSRDIYYADSRREVCEDINECLFDVCKDLANVSTCINEIGDYRCHCNRHYIGDNKKFCTHVCNTIPCKHGKCRLVDDHHAFCECDDGYKDTDCSVQDPNVALRKANMIICGSIFTSVLLLAITFAISLNSQLKRTKKKLRRLEAINEAARLIEFGSHQQPFSGRPRMSKVSG